jgi:hypothetical protein
VSTLSGKNARELSDQRLEANTVIHLSPVFLHYCGQSRPVGSNDPHVPQKIHSTVNGTRQEGKNLVIC